MKPERLIAYHLPQYHPIPENDRWWGKGFTEWTNVAKALPLYQHHNQPRLPADLGYYDLRLPEVREQQAALAREYGIHGFCYYHYWFENSRLLLERPLQEILKSRKPDFPFMMCWANQTWKGVWFGSDNPETLIEQLYPGKQDYLDHFNYLLPFFSDPRYITIEGKPVFHVYMPMDIPDLKVFTDTFRESAYRAGLKGIYLLATNCPDDWNPAAHNFDGVIPNIFHRIRYNTAKRIVKDRHAFFGKVETKVRMLFGDKQIGVRSKPVVIPYEKAITLLSKWSSKSHDTFPMVIPDWDNSPRAGRKSLIFHGSSPGLWKSHLQSAMDFVRANEDEKKVIFIKSWNEWAESNYLEPDQKWGHQYLEVVREVLNNYEHA